MRPIFDRPFADRNHPPLSVTVEKGTGNGLNDGLIAAFKGYMCCDSTRKTSQKQLKKVSKKPQNKLNDKSLAYCILNA
jgi:hypothetical protein